MNQMSQMDQKQQPTSSNLKDKDNMKMFEQIVEDPDGGRINEQVRINAVNTHATPNEHQQLQQHQQHQQYQYPPIPVLQPVIQEEERQPQKILYCGGRFTLKQLIVSSSIVFLFVIFIISLLIALNNYSQSIKVYVTASERHRNKNSNQEISAYIVQLQHYKLIGDYPNVTGRVTTVGPVTTDHRLLYIGRPFKRPPPISTITFVHKPTLTVFNAYNPNNFQIYVNGPVIINYYTQNYWGRAKRLLTYLQLYQRNLQTDIREHQVPIADADSEADIKFKQSLQRTFCEVTGQDKETTQITEVPFHKGVQQNGQFFLQTADEPISSRLLQAIAKSKLTEAQKQQIFNDIIGKIIKPFLEQSVNKIKTYGSQIAKQLDITFDEAVDVLLTKEKKQLIGSSTNNYLITTVYTPLFVNRPKDIKQTKTATQRTYTTVRSCHDHEKIKFCTVQEFNSAESPYKVSHRKGSTKQYKIHKFWRVNLKLKQQKTIEANLDFKISTVTKTDQGKKSSQEQQKQGHKQQSTNKEINPARIEQPDQNIKSDTSSQKTHLTTQKTANIENSVNTKQKSSSITKEKKQSTETTKTKSSESKPQNSQSQLITDSKTPDKSSSKNDVSTGGSTISPNN